MSFAAPVILSSDDEMSDDALDAWEPPATLGGTLLSAAPAAPAAPAPTAAAAVAAANLPDRRRSMPAAGWRTPAPPPSYGTCDDSMLVRHVRVSASASLHDIKVAILKAFEDQYAPSDITLFTRKYDDEPARVTTDRAAKLKLLSYGPDWDALAEDPSAVPDSVLLIVSAMDESEASLLVLPAAHSPPEATVLEHMRPAIPPSAAHAEEALLPQRLVGVQPGLFDPLPLPAHIDDWLAQYREAPQTVAELATGPHARRIPGRDAIYLQPLRCTTKGKGGKGRSDASGSGSSTAEPDEDAMFASLRDYLAAFYHGTRVELLPALTISVDAAKGSGSLLGKPVRWRDYCAANGEALPDGQLDAGMVLNALKPRITKSGVVKGTGALPDDGHCVLGVTLTDFFCSDDDIFTSGLACLSSRAGAFSFYRYGERGDGQSKVGKKDGKGAGGVDSGVVLARACKTAAHEILHIYGIGHCLHRACLMNGTGHLKEDFQAPPTLCPVDLAKLQAALGPRCELRPRYRAMLAFCEAQPSGFDEQARWIRRALAALGGQQGPPVGVGSKSDGDEAAEAPPKKQCVRK